MKGGVYRMLTVNIPFSISNISKYLSTYRIKTLPRVCLD